MNKSNSSGCEPRTVYIYTTNDLTASLSFLPLLIDCLGKRGGDSRNRLILSRLPTKPAMRKEQDDVLASQ